MSLTGLKPCPFCGSNRLVILGKETQGRKAYAVSCYTRDCHGCNLSPAGGYAARADAIAAWNTRAEPDTEDAELRAKDG